MAIENSLTINLPHPHTLLCQLLVVLKHLSFIILHSNFRLNYYYYNIELPLLARFTTRGAAGWLWESRFARSICSCSWYRGGWLECSRYLYLVWLESPTQKLPSEEQYCGHREKWNCPYHVIVSQLMVEFAFDKVGGSRIHTPPPPSLHLQAVYSHLQVTIGESQYFMTPWSHVQLPDIKAILLSRQGIKC